MLLHSGFQSHQSPRGVCQNVSVSDSRGTEWEHGCMFAFTFPAMSAEGRLAQGLPSCSTQNNTKSVSNPLSSSLIQDNCRSLTWTLYLIVGTIKRSYSVYDHQENHIFTYSTLCLPGKDNRWPLSHPSAAATVVAFSVFQLFITCFLFSYPHYYNR